MTISFESKVRVPNDVLVSELDGESVLLNLSTASYFGLDDVGTQFLEALKTTDTLGAAFDLLAGQYDVEEEALRTDLTDFVRELAQRGLVEVVSE